MSPADALREFGLTYPGAELKSPWPEHLDLAVKGKTFAFLSAPGQPFSITCKLPFTGEGALEEHAWAEKTGYGLGKSGWVSAKPAEDEVDLALFKNWIDESYRAVAPKSLLKQLIARG
ncbi:MAG: hypothetical protein BGN86_16820 [Caulobacterales bacterium 68-7]|nr:MAG: hypothetical protein BGN86_16820 [Caulobacterales bacterium 68-7]